ncbi:GNAT family N-acetyltransferase [Vibrio sp. S9_S30]|uniref:GNAT family N-acetyltransferase n=1 Tax=Vibrio sp. S9_S30 TaxID=2720226 RepID=UPI00168027F6|nr:GNAT family N-acetyltransferase [Vibrio sp. S9_S30]MBD1556418.1 GNAT family N-acetyltransferase [Vibrio sp. S9_S30]
MKLVQLTPDQFERTLHGEPTFAYMDGAIPPKHVLMRAWEQYKNSVDIIWALPYFIEIDGQMVGCCGFKYAPHADGVEIGYNVAPNARGIGVATSAVKALNHIAFQSDVVNHTKALIAKDNVASLNVIKKNGFIYKGMVEDKDGEQLEHWEFTLPSNP